MTIPGRATTFTYGTTGNDIIYAQYLDGDLIDGLAGDDIIFGSEGRQGDFGPTGSDTLIGGDGRDTIYGLGGHDQIFGGSGNDQLYGGAGNDALQGGAGNDRLYGGDGDDFITPDSDAIGSDYIDGGLGNDTLSYSLAPVTRGVRVDLGKTSSQDTLGAGRDTIINIENVVGTAFGDSLTGNSANNRLEGLNGNDALNGMGGNDVLVGGAGNDTMYGGSGNDWFYADSGGAGNDTMDGGTGFDSVSYYGVGLTSGVTINLNITTAQNTGGGGIDTFRNIERVDGTDFADVLIGNAGDNTFSAGAGNDTVYGGNGNDWIYSGFGDGGTTNYIDGGNGNDTLEGSGGADTMIGGAGDDRFRPSNDLDVMEGGAGADLFWFRDGDSFILNGVVSDVIRDYNAAEDDIQIFNYSWAPPAALQSITDLGDGGQRASFVFADHGGVATLFIDVYGSPVTAADFTFTSIDPFLV